MFKSAKNPNNNDNNNNNNTHTHTHTHTADSKPGRSHRDNYREPGPRRQAQPGGPGPGLLHGHGERGKVSGLFADAEPQLISTGPRRQS